ncbi:MAG TPA: lipopolysaccharide heptosyltransferase II [Thermoanaerobaculia bacterium]|jgi:heptosyltransferase-2|nr:lipopolysaccharide heptosyltransferase II [Thermoanaerobaculia bacterium]
MVCETVVIGLNWVGDNVLALPTFKALQHRFRAEGGIAVAAPANVATLLETTGVFKQVVAWNRGTRHRVAALRAGGFKRAVILPNSFRAAAIAFAAGIPERWGYPSDWRGFMLTNPVSKPQKRGHQVDDYTPLLNALDATRVTDDLPTIKLPQSVHERGKRRLLNIGLHLDRPVIGIHPGGLYGKAKHWGDAAYVDVIKRLRTDGFDIVLLTSPREREQAERIAMTCNGVPMVGHDGDVLELAAAISQCAAVITNDSGPLHVATALAVPSVSIFGPTDPERTVFPGATRVVRRTLACQPCYQRECPLGHHRCMAEVSVDEVFNAAVGMFEAIERPVAAEEPHVRL